jgi:homopolymeric O-antigen transport system permease protein
LRKSSTVRAGALPALLPQVAQHRPKASIMLILHELILAPFAYLWAKRKTIFRLYVLDLKANAAGSFIGNWWALLYPLIYFSSYIILFAFVFRVSFTGLSALEYIGMILVGLAPALAFAQAVAGGVSSIVGTAGLLKGTLIEIETIPAKQALASQAVFVTGITVALLFFVGYGRIGWMTFLLAPIWILQLLFTVGILWILAPLNVYLRDLGQIVPALITPLMMISPIAYPVANAPDAIKFLLWFNPFYYFIACYQDAIVFLRFPDLRIFAAFVVMALGSFIFGFRVISRAKAALLDGL